MIEPAPPRQRSWLTYAALGWFGGYVASVLTLGFYSAVTGDTKGLGPLVASQLGLWFAWGATALWASRMTGTGSAVEDFGIRALPLDPLLGITVGALSQFVLVPIVQWPVTWFVHDANDKVEKVTAELLGGVRGAKFVAFGLFIAIGAGIVEELFFRGLLQRAVARRSSAVWGIVIASAVFAITHFAPVELPALFAFGLVLGFLYERTGRLGLVMITHAAFDAFAVFHFGFSHHLI